MLRQQFRLGRLWSLRGVAADDMLTPVLSQSALLIPQARGRITAQIAVILITQSPKHTTYFKSYYL